ncbi:MAG: ATP-dependent DNA helicase [Deltaproteobacteria bacterium]
MGNFEERYGKLNPEQREAVDYINGPLLVVAGPGTGKTEILGLRIANILRKTDTSPRNVLCLTFTNSASHNMRKRLSELIGQDAYKVAIHTFHSFGVEIISGYPEYFYSGTIFSPVDDLGQIQILEEIIEELSYDDPLRTIHPEGGYAYINSIKEAIGDLKKAGLTPEEFRLVLERNKTCYEHLNPQINSVFAPRIAKKSIGIVAGLVENLSSENALDTAFLDIKSIVESVRHSLTHILEDAERSAKTKPLSDWKSEYTKKDDNGALVLKDSLYSDKLFSLADVYEEYQERLYKERCYDFDDMILEAIQGIETNKSLGYELHQKYEYILVDEFQDTNEAQMRLLRLITKYGEDGREPNVMVVGDDDQAIYKFQGAELSNVLNFQKIYPDTKVLSITSNYRSTQDVLDLARFIITKGEERLENLYPDIDKNIVSSNARVEPGEIVSKSFPTNLHEYFWVGREIERLIQTGKCPSSIAVIARNHRQLEEIALLLNKMEIPLIYERYNNVLREPHVRQLIQISRFISSVCRKNMDEADEYLPEILSYPFWKIDRKVIWDISKKAGNRRAGWLDIMESYHDENIKRVADFLIQLGKESSFETLEHILDRIMGAHEELVPDNDEDELESPDGVSDQKFVSPFKDYYFGERRLEENRVEYIKFLSGLRTFIQALRDYRKGELLKIDDLAEFVGLHEKNNVPVIDNSFFVNSGDSVSLLTAHKAKGLEFDTVFVINCQEEIWTRKGRGSLLPFPLNLPISPAGDTLDDQLRLFYVAVTRAGSNLYITSYETKENGNISSRLHFIQDSGESEESGAKLRKALSVDREDIDVSEIPDTGDVLTVSWESYHAPPVVHDEKAVFEKTLEEYKLSVTHLNNFLNVTKGGPRLFFEQNLLRFPQSKTPEGSYGSAIHRIMEAVYRHLKQAGELPSLEMVLGWYERELAYERLNEKHFKDYLKKGRDRLTIFYDKKIENFHPSHFSEVNFSDQGVVIGKAHLTGKIDKMVPLNEAEIAVHDFKTGKHKTDWKGSGQYEKIQLHQYKRQLVFYKLLVEHSKDYGAEYKVNRGVLEFIEPEKGELFDLRAEIEREECERTAQLASIVFDKISNLNFPDVRRYAQDLSGILNFEDDLLEGKV